MKKAGKSNITVIIPTLNEEENISNVIRELHQIGYHDILVIDGNSKDGTVEVSKNLGANVITQNGNGKGNALRQAFNNDDLYGDYVVIIDADGSMDPKEVPLLIEALKSGADVVKGSRFLLNGHSKDLNLVRTIGNKIIILLTNFVWSTSYTDICYGFMAFRKESLKKLSPCLSSENFEIETEICIKAKNLGLKVIEIPSVELKRFYGRSRLSTFRDGFRIFRKIIGVQKI